MADAFDLHGPDINDHFGLGEEFRDTGKELYERDKGDNRDEDNGHGDTYSFGEVDTYNGPYEQTSNQDEFNFETASAPNEVEKPEEISIKTYEPMDFSFLSVDSGSEEDKDKYRNKTYATGEQMDDFFGFMKDKQADYNNREFERKEKERKEKEIDDFRNELKKGLDSLKTGIEKSKDKRPDFEIKSPVPPSPGSGVRGQLEKDAKTSPMYAEAGVPASPKLTTDLNATPEEMEAAKKQALEPKWNDIERISKDFDFSNAREPETKEVGWGPFKHEVLADNKIAGLYTPQQMKEMDNFINKTESKLGQNITDVANKVTAGIAPTTENITEKFDRTNYKSAVDQVAQDYLSKGKDVQQAIDYVNKLVEDASMGLAKQGIEYYLLTGDALNKAAESVQAAENQILVSLEKGAITEEKALEAIDKVHQVTNVDQLKSLATSPALQGIEINLAAMGAGALLSQAAKAAVSKLVKTMIDKPTKLGDKVLKALSKNKAVRESLKNSKLSRVYSNELDKAPYTYSAKLDDLAQTLSKDPRLSKQISELLESATKENESLLNRNVGNILHRLKVGDYDELLPRDVEIIKEALARGIITGKDVAEAFAKVYGEKVESGVKSAAGVAGAGAAVGKASATPTGTFDNSGKQVDSRNIVSEYKKNPYTGVDAVTLQTREGQVTLPLHEAVIVGEAEKLTPERGYTEEVKKAAEGMDVYERQPETRKAEVVDINNLPPDLPEKSFWTKAGDVVQAILGGRDTNNDRTISAHEWYESTLKPVADAMKDFFSLPDFKSKLEAIGNKIEATLYNITSSIPGVIDLNTGEVQTIDQPIKATKETINNIEDKIINALPNWTDGVKKETIKEGVADIVAGKIGNQFYGDSVAAVTLAKIAGAYTAATVGEIAHLYGKDLTNDEKGVINLVVTNAVGLPLAPVTSIVRDMQAMTGIPARARIEKTFNPDEAGSIMIIPYSEGTSGRSSGTKSSYGWSSDITNADSKYSGYRERAKNTNLATDYNEGLAQEMNEAVSDMKVKIFNVYKNEPDYIRKAIDKVLKSYKEQW